MTNLASLRVEEIKDLTKSRKVDGYENMSRQHLENSILLKNQLPNP